MLSCSAGMLNNFFSFIVQLFPILLLTIPAVI